MSSDRTLRLNEHPEVSDIAASPTLYIIGSRQTCFKLLRIAITLGIPLVEDDHHEVTLSLRSAHTVRSLTMGSIQQEQAIDVLVVGAGFGGCYLLHLLRQHNFRTKVVDAASSIGGVWAWNVSACPPSKKLRLYKTNDWLIEVPWCKGRL